MGWDRNTMIKERKFDHIKICATRKVESGDTLFSEVELLHKAAPEISKSEVDLSAEFLGRKFDFPIAISAITGGCKEAERINGNLAQAAEKFNIPLELGSQRAGIEDPKLSRSYSIVRKYAPDAFVIGNLGAVQFSNGFGMDEVQSAAGMIKADALAIHFNALQEAVQPEGDTNFSGVLDNIKKLNISVPLVAKETGCGISKEQAQLFRECGFRALDLGGKGGTNFALVESYRGSAVGSTFADWGIPTARSILECRGVLPMIASGGIRNGLDAAKAIALGADLAGFALPLLKPAMRSAKAVEGALDPLIEELRISMFLLGCKTIPELKRSPVILKGSLLEAARQRGLL